MNEWERNLFSSDVLLFLVNLSIHISHLLILINQEKTLKQTILHEITFIITFVKHIEIVNSYDWTRKYSDNGIIMPLLT